MTTVQDFIYGYSGKQYELLQRLHNYIMGYPGMTDKISYSIPFYYRKSWICYLNPLKPGGVELAFTRANELFDAQHFLDFNGRKQVAGITYHDPSKIDENLLRLIINEALILDEKVPYSVKRKIKK